MIRTRLTLVALAAALALPALSACSGSNTVPATIREVDGTTLTQLAGAGAAVRAARSVSFTVTEHVVAGGKTEDVTGTGGYDYTRNDGVLHLTTAGQQVTVIVTPTLVYEMLPAGSAAAGGTTTPWISVPVSSVVTAAGRSSVAAGDPTQALDQLASLSDVKAVGSETIRGTATTHYTGTADPTKSPALLTPAERAKATVSLSGIASVPVDLWLDAAGLPRRFTTTLTTTSAAQSVAVTSTYELFDVGAPVTVTVPAPDVVTARTSLTG